MDSRYRDFIGALWIKISWSRNINAPFNFRNAYTMRDYASRTCRCAREILAFPLTHVYVRIHISPLRKHKSYESILIIDKETQRRWEESYHQANRKKIGRKYLRKYSFLVLYPLERCFQLNLLQPGVLFLAIFQVNPYIWTTVYMRSNIFRYIKYVKTSSKCAP